MHIVFVPTGGSLLHSPPKKCFRRKLYFFPSQTELARLFLLLFVFTSPFVLLLYEGYYWNCTHIQLTVRACVSFFADNFHWLSESGFWKHFKPKKCLKSNCIWGFCTTLFVSSKIDNQYRSKSKVRYRNKLKHYMFQKYWLYKFHWKTKERRCLKVCKRGVYSYRSLCYAPYL